MRLLTILCAYFGLAASVGWSQVDAKTDNNPRATRLDLARPVDMPESTDPAHDHSRSLDGVSNRLSQPTSTKLRQGPAKRRDLPPPWTAPQMPAPQMPAPHAPWPQPLGSRLVSPKSVDYRPFMPIQRQPQLQDSAAAPLSRAVAHKSSNTPAEGEESPKLLTEIPESEPSNETPQPIPPNQATVPQRALSTALPWEYTLSMTVPTARATGQSSRMVLPLTDLPSRPEIMLQPLGPPSLYGAKGWYPLGGVCPEETFAVGRRPVAAGLGVQLYDQYINGNYGETDVSSRTQALLRQAQIIGEIPTPP